MTKSGEGFRTKFIDERDWEDPETLATALAEDFSLEDPSEPEPITKATIAARMGRWVDRMKAIGGKGQVENSDEALDDRFKVRQAMAAV